MNSIAQAMIMPLGSNDQRDKRYGKAWLNMTAKPSVSSTMLNIKRAIPGRKCFSGDLYSM